MKTLIILNDPPYGTERTYNGLRLAHALPKAGSDITVFMLGDAVVSAKQGQRTPEGFYNVERMIGRVLAAGGTLAEIYRDAALRLAPVSLEEARAMIDEVRGFAPLAGYRNAPRGDLEALARAIVAFSRLATLPDVLEAEINPLIVKAQGEGVIGVDALLVLREGAHADGPAA